MKFNERTRAMLSVRRFEKKAASDGFVKIKENGTPLFKLHRGDWIDHKIVEAIISPNGRDVWIRVEKR